MPDRVMELVQVYGDARADDKYSALRLSELIYALRQWAGTLKAAQAEPAGGDKESVLRWLRDNDFSEEAESVAARAAQQATGERG